MTGKSSIKSRRVCNSGHVYYKSSDYPVCPVCEKEKMPEDGFFSTIAAPARRALKNAGIKTLEQLSKKNESEILKLHGMGPGSIPKLKSALKTKGLAFRK